MSKGKDNEMLADLTDFLQGDEWFNMVAAEIAKQRGVPLTEPMRRELVARLRAGTTAIVKPEPPKPN